MTGNDCPLVSVIIPYYNGRKFIREALQSIQDQTYPRIEIIVVDDASPDREDAASIQSLSRERGFKLIIHPVNKGIGPTMADAAEASRGDYIAELSQDDLFKPQKIEKQMTELTGNKLKVVYAVGDILDQATRRVRMRDMTKTRQIIQSGKASDYLKIQNLAGISIQGLLAERSVFEVDVIPIWRDYLLDDWPVNIRLFEKYNVGFLEEPLWTSRGHDTNTSRNIWKWLGPQVEVVARMAPEPLKVEAVGNRIGSMARRLLKQGGTKEDITRFAAAALMLTDSPEQHIKASRVLEKLSSKDKKAVLNHKCRALDNAIALPCETLMVPKTSGQTNWNSIGKEISEVVKTRQAAAKVSEIGRRFAMLAHHVMQNTPSENVETAAKIALCGFILVREAEDEGNISKMIQLFQSDRSRQLIKSKTKMLKSKTGFSLKSFLKFLMAILFADMSVLFTCEDSI